MGHIKRQRAITTLVVVIAVAATAAAITGIVSAGGPGPRIHETFRGTEVTLYGRGIYRHMSADVAIQGIAQDVVTVAIAVPLLLLGPVYLVFLSLMMTPPWWPS
ncbi:MAG: hypothetical protein WD492_13890 [Alkalispirochaeta sp.]